MTKCAECGSEFESYYGHTLCSECYQNRKHNNTTSDYLKYMWHRQRSKNNSKDSIDTKDTIPIILYGDTIND